MKVSRYNNGDVIVQTTGDNILIKEHKPVETEIRLPSGRRDAEFQVGLSRYSAEVYRWDLHKL